MKRSIRLLSIAHCLVTATLAVNGIFAPVAYNSTLDWSTVRHVYRFPPLIVQSNGSLIHVLDSADDREHAIHVYTLDHGLCKVPLKLPFRQRYPRRATSLGNGKIVVWLLNYQLTHHSHRASPVHEAKWRFAIVDPRSCSCAPDILAIKDSELESKSVDVVDVVGHRDHFEVFLYPLTHNAQGNIYGFGYRDDEVPIAKPSVNSVIADNEPHSRYQPNTVRIHTVLSHDSSAGYHYLRRTSKPDKLTIKRLEPDFSESSNWRRRDISLDGTSSERFDSYSIGHGSFTYCRNHVRRLNCTFLDARTLLTRMNASLDYEVDYFSKIGRTSVVNTADGGALLAVAVESNYRVGPPVYLQRIHSDGRVEAPPRKIGRFYCEIRQLSVFEMTPEDAAGDFCVCVVCDEVVHTRCFALPANANAANGEINEV